jgi:hypothetical protein
LCADSSDKDEETMRRAIEEHRQQANTCTFSHPLMVFIRDGIDLVL